MNKSNVSCYNEDFYYKLYIMNERNESNLKDYCVYLDITLEKFFIHVVNYINKNKTKPEYVKVLDKLSTLTDNDKVIKYLNSVSIDYKILKDNLMDYFINYRPDIYYTNESLKKRIRDNLTLYEIYKYKLDRPSNAETMDMNDFITTTVMEYIESPYSIARFCYNKGLNKTLFSKYVNTIKTKNPELYDRFIEVNNYKEQIRKEIIENDVYTILKEIKENPEFSIIDFLLTTNYDVLEIVAIADTLLSLDDIKLFRKNIRPIRYLNRSNEKQTNNIMNSNYTFNINGILVTLTDEDKHNILEFIKQHSIPMSIETFQNTCLKYLNNKLEKGCSK